MQERITNLCDQYRDWAEVYYRRPDGTLTGQHRNVGDALRELENTHGDAAVSSFGLRHLNEVQDAMARSGRLSRETINSRIKVIRAMFRWAANKGVVDELLPHKLSAIQPLKRGRTRAHEPKPMQGVDWQLVSDTLPFLSLKLATMVEVQWWSAMRPGEVCAMRLSEIHPSSDDVWHFCPKQHKTSHHGIARRVSLGRISINLIRAWMPHVKGDWLFPGGRGHATSDGPMLVNSYRNEIVKACEAGELTRWSPAAIRHATLTRTYQEYDILHAMEQAGHTTERTTQRYIDRPVVTFTLADQVARERG